MIQPSVIYVLIAVHASLIVDATSGVKPEIIINPGAFPHGTYKKRDECISDGSKLVAEMKKNRYEHPDFECKQIDFD